MFTLESISIDSFFERISGLESSKSKFQFIVSAYKGMPDADMKMIINNKIDLIVRDIFSTPSYYCQAIQLLPL